MFDEICYKTPFLKDVIFKADFPSPIEKIAKGLSPKLNKIILKKFPIPEPQKAQAQEFQFSGNNFQAKTSEVMQWIFHGRQREKTLAITPNAFSYNTKKYISFESTRDDFVEVLEAFFGENKDVTAGRIGLRYINVIDIPDEDPLLWETYINEKMLGIIDFHKDKHFLTRAFHILEYNFDGLAIKYQFGMANPDFPAPIKKKQFILDIDAFSHGALECDDVIEFLENAHLKIQDIFEASITDKTREIMGLMYVEQ